MDPAQGYDSPGPDRARRVSGLVLGVAAAALVSWFAGVFTRVQLLTDLPLLQAVNPDRREELVGIYVSLGLLRQTALLAPPLVVIATLALLVAGSRPLTDAGLFPVGRGVMGLTIGLAEGFVWCAYSLVALGLISSATRVAGNPNAVEYVLLVGLHNAGEMLSAGWRPPLLLLAALAAYALGRLVISHGLVVGGLRDIAHPAGVSLAAALLFAVGGLASPFVTPLAMFNLFLAGLLFERLRTLSGTLAYPVGALAGWVLVGAMARQPMQGAPALGEPAIFASLPSILSGGPYGFEGGLVVSVVLTLALAVLLRRRKPVRPVVANG